MGGAEARLQERYGKDCNNRKHGVQKSVLSQFPQPLFHDCLALKVKCSPDSVLTEIVKPLQRKVVDHPSKNAV